MRGWERSNAALDESLKQRLVGAAVIISLVVIFLPMILDGGRYTEFKKIRIEIPARPGMGFSSSIAPLVPAEPRTIIRTEPSESAAINRVEAQGKASIIDEELAEIIKPIEAPERIVSKQGVRVTPSSTEQAKPASTLKKVMAKAAPTKVATARPVKTSRAKPLPGPTAVTAWVVQVGSFSSRESAIELRNKLRKKGFVAFVESFDNSGQAAHRVRIGPETSRGRADRTLAGLHKKMQIKGIVVSYP